MKRNLAKRALSILLTGAMVFSGSITDFSKLRVYGANEAVIATEGILNDSELSTTADYTDVDVQDGVILHAWEWSFNNIKNNMAKIADAGYTAVQTSVIQQAKESTKGKTNADWWLYYQPANFTIDNTGNSALGNKSDFSAMCAEAHKYGIKVIVDVVANHLGNQSSYDRSSAIPSDIKDDENCWHSGTWNVEISDYTNRERVINYSMGGLPDLNTENSKIQNYVITYLKECIDAGADGFRFDAAKHIGTEADGSGYTFWKNVIPQAKAYYKSNGYFKSSKDLYVYGEILDDTAGNHSTIINNYTQFMKVTDNKTGNDIRYAVIGHNASSASSSYYQKGVTGDNVVLWAESHDTYSNEDVYSEKYGRKVGTSTEASESDINKTWTLVSSRNKATALYFARTKDWRAGNIGDIDNTQCFSTEVVASNKFHNYFTGAAEYLGSSGNFAYNARYDAATSRYGVVIVNCNGTSSSVSISGGGIAKLADGTYKDQVSGNTFTVSGGAISGSMGSTGIAVVYNEGEIITKPSISISKQGGSFSSDTLDLTLTLKNATSGTYKIGSAEAKTITSTTNITIGSDMSYGDSVTVKLTATDGKESTENEYTFTKIEQTGYVAYFAKPSSWGSDVYCYAYDSATETVNNGTWPGEKMSVDATTGYYYYEVPEKIDAPRVIFYNSDSNRTPADMEKGYLFESKTAYLYKDGSWSVYTPVVAKGKITFKYVDAEGKEIKASETKEGTLGSKFSGSYPTIDGYEYKSVTGDAVYADPASTVTVVYNAVSVSDIKITSSQADGTSFKTETLKTTITLKNATSGTYCVDGGVVKSFKDSAEVVLGQGKIADSTVTLKVTATDGTQNAEQTFTFKKEFSGKVVNEEDLATSDNELSAASALTVAAEISTAATNAGLSTKAYSTNATGVGAEKTITIDGDASDWDSSMLIATGGAWDVANHWKGGHENCVLDTTALYAAYDDSNLYIGWQMVNTTDTWAREGDGPLSDGGRVLDVPLILALSVDPSSTSMSNKNTSGGSIWGQKMGLTFDATTSHVDRLFYMSGKPGLGEPSMFKAVDSEGNTNYTDGCVGFAKGGITYDMATTNISSSIIGLNSSDSPDDVCDDSADWVDYKTFAGSSGTHKTTYDSFYEIAIPYSNLGDGVDKNYIKNTGIGAMLVATRGESALDCIPFDVSMIDNAEGDYSSDASTSAEKDDIDNITASFARIGKGDIVVPTKELTVNFGAEVSSPQYAKDTINLKAIASGGSGSYKYEFVIDGKSVQDASSTSTFKWNGAAGSHLIKVVVTDSEGKSVTCQKAFALVGEEETTSGQIETTTKKQEDETTTKKQEDETTTKQEEVKAPKISSITTNKKSGTVTAGQSVKISVKATGTGTLKYKYVVKLKGESSGKVREYSTSSSVNWTPKKAGNYIVYVYVKDSYGNVTKKSKKYFKVYSELKASAIKVSKKSGKAKVGNTIKLKATGKGGIGTRYYRFYYKLNGKKVLIQNYRASLSASLKLKKAGTYIFFCDVTDEMGNESTVKLSGYKVVSK